MIVDVSFLDIYGMQGYCVVDSQLNAIMEMS